MNSVVFLASLFFLIFANGSDDYLKYPEVGVSYKIFTTPMKWIDAKIRCVEEGAMLAMPKNNAEALILKRIFEQYPASVLPSNTDKDYIVLDSHEMFQEGNFLTQGYNIQYFYHKWHNQEPNSPDEKCLTMHRVGKLNDHNCDINFIFICQKEDSPYLKILNKRTVPTQDPAYKYESHSGKYFKMHMHVRDWPTAHAVCHAEGGQLAIVESKQEENFLVNMFNNPDNQWPHVVNKNYAFIGFHDIYRKGTFFTVDDRQLEDIGYVNWGANEPNHESEKERCGSISTSGGLNDYRCDIPLQFFCEQSVDLELNARFN